MMKHRGAARNNGAVYPLEQATFLFLALFVATALAGAVGLGGLFERLLAASGAAGIALLAAGVLQRS